MGIVLPNPFRPKRVAEHRRYDVRLTAGLVLLPRDIEVEGMILNVSEGGCLFRPFQHYLMNRSGDMVQVAFAGNRVEGRVMNTIERGYGIAFKDLVDISIFGVRRGAA
ncbi:MAG: PilZ domain-containing protein [Alphaproteobacteria bacterium]|nr:PilZ domain-containing protein [Alphaproteobacteria bacterium]